MSAPGKIHLLLHAHLPFVREPEFDRFLEENWFFEAMAETYLPLIQMLWRLQEKGVPGTLNLSVSSALLAMLTDKHLLEKFTRHLHKHFPGHGDTSADSHYGAVYVNKTLDELRGAELLPFKTGIAADADAVMMGHLIVSDVDSEPAPFSYTLVTEILREEMGFDGVVVTDSLRMKALTDYYTSGEIAVKAIKAGVDVLLCPEDLEEAVNALVTAIEEGEISEARIDESVARILELKLQYGIMQ